MVKVVKDRYVSLKQNKAFRWSLTLGIIFFVLSIIVNFYAGLYASIDASNPVSDVILSNIRVYDVDEFFVYGSFIFVFLVAAACSMYPQRLPFVLKSVSLFIIIRAIFINLTHIAPFPTHVAIDPLSFINKFTFSGDLFFSGHTGMPFLIALIFWDNKYIRIFFLAVSVFFATIALMGHLHYSIDVFAAYFITYSIYHISAVGFKKDCEIGRTVR